MTTATYSAVAVPKNRAAFSAIPWFLNKAPDLINPIYSASEMGKNSCGNAVNSHVHVEIKLLRDGPEYHRNNFCH